MPSCFAFRTSPPLSSTASAHGLSSLWLFGGFSGTMGESDFSWPYMHGLRFHLSMPFSRFHQATEYQETSRLPLREFPYMPGSWTSWGRMRLAITPHSILPSAHMTASAHPNQVFRRSMAGLHVPLSTLRRQPHDCQRMTRGKRGSLLLRNRVSSTPAL
jgi:hypothetical protein